MAGVPLFGEIALSAGTEGFPGRVGLGANATGTGYFAVWGIDGQFTGRLVGGDGTPLTGEFLLDPSAQPIPFGVGVARLPDGRFVTTYTDFVDVPDDVDAHAQIIFADGSLAGRLDVAAGSFAEIFSD